MKYLQKNILISALLFLTSLHVVGQATSSLKEDLKLMTSLMKGEFDNFQQITQEIDTKVKNKHNRVHTVFAPIEVPSIGQNVFYVKQYFDDNANQFFQWIYVLNEDATEKAIRLDKYNFKVDTTYINVY